MVKVNDVVTYQNKKWQVLDIIKTISTKKIAYLKAVGHNSGNISVNVKDLT